MESTYLSQDTNANSFKVKENKDDFRLEQDVSAYKEYAAQQRLLDTQAHSARQYRSYAILPDIVCIDILTKYGLDVHAPDFMDNPANLRKLKQIIDSDYALLKTSNVKAL
jgi:hypothetical protein